MTQLNVIQFFEGKQVRIAWNEEEEKYYFSVADIVQILTDSKDVKQYIKRMRARDPELNSKWGTICTPVEMLAPDGKRRKTQAADLEGIFRIIQSIPSKKAEPVKKWLAEVGREQKDFAILTNILTKAWSGMTTGEYKRYKGLTKENLRDNMTNLELALNTLAEAATTEISRNRNPQTMQENKRVAQSGGKAAKAARDEVEKQIGHSVISHERAADYLLPTEDAEVKEIESGKEK